MFLLVTSAAAIAGILTPKTKKDVTDRWVSSLVGQLVFPFIFLLLLFISLTILDGMDLFKKPPSWSAIGERGDANALLALALPLILIVMSLNVAKSVAGKSSSFTTGAMQKVGGFASRRAFGTVGFAGRRGIGRPLRAISNKMDPDSRFGKGTQRVLGAIGSASFDVRKIKGVAGLSKMAGVDVGKAGGKGGYNKIAERAKKRNDAAMEKASQMNDKEINEAAEFAAIKNGYDDLNKSDKESISKENERGDEIVSEIKRLTDEIKNNASQGQMPTQAQQDKLDDLSKEKAFIESTVKSINKRIGETSKKSSDQADNIKAVQNKAKARGEQFYQGKTWQPKNKAGYAVKKVSQLFTAGGTRDFIKKQKIKAAEEASKTPEQRATESVAKAVKKLQDADAPKDKKDSESGGEGGGSKKKESGSDKGDK